MDPVVTTKNGSIRGTIEEDYKGNPFYSFKGIPYAKPPLGELRFKPPVPAEPWTGVIDASKFGNVCYQNDFILKKTGGSEDCLYLNVYTKELSSKQLKPVMVWIHGGGFHWGSGNDDCYGPEFLVTADVVLVTINYRLGYLGFLSFEDESLGVTGNAGLKDQVLALKWVKENIKNFGGNPDNVTIFGESAGAASVHYLVISPATKGLFHKAIIQSGSVLNEWSLGDHMSKEIWNEFGIKEDDPKKVLDYLRSLPVEKLLEIQPHFGQNRVCAPAIESPNAEQPIITKNSYDIIKSGEYNHIPIMFGTTSEEGLFLLGAMNKVEPIPYEEFSKFVFDALPKAVKSNLSNDQVLASIEKIKKYYFGEKIPSKVDTLILSEITSELTFNQSTFASVRHHIKTSTQPLYLYKFSLESDLGWAKKCFNIQVPGTCHLDDVGYLFKSKVFSPDVKSGSLEDQFVQKVVKLWTNFAKTGNPTVQWEPVKTGERGLYYNISNECKMENETGSKRITFWDNLYLNDFKQKHFFF